jgi:hypothetical protein
LHTSSLNLRPPSVCPFESRNLSHGSLKRASKASLIGLEASLQREEEAEPLFQFWNAPAAHLARCSPRQVARNIVDLNRERSEALAQRSR